MKVRVPGSVRTPAIRPQPVGPGRLRKIGIIGGSPESLAYVPWADPTWEFWTHSSCVLAIPYLRADRIFDVHPDHCFTEARKNGFKDYYGFLRGCPTPIYMHRKVEEIPQSVVYPYRLLKQFWPGVPFGSQTAFMVALALYEGVTHLGFWGVSYAHETEYARQRSNAEQWVGIAHHRGAQGRDGARQGREGSGRRSWCGDAPLDSNGYARGVSASRADSRREAGGLERRSGEVRTGRGVSIVDRGEGEGRA